MRVAIIGARRVRQGLGPYLARFVVEAGAELCAVVGTTAASSQAAADALREDLGVQPSGVTDIKGVMEAGAQALVIAAPHETHAAWLEHALQHGLHVLCEKPLVWGGDDPAGDAERVASRFLAERLHLHVNTQWPWSLDSYRTLWPDIAPVPHAFSMTMPPRLTGLAACLDCLSHPLSMLASLAPDPEATISRIALRTEGGGDGQVEVAFVYEGAGHVIDVKLSLDPRPDEQRTTAYALDGAWVRRTVDPGDYSMTLEAIAEDGSPLPEADRRIPLPDPTPRLVRSFLDAIAAGPSTGIDPAAVPGMRHLAQIMAAANEHFGDSAP